MSWFDDILASVRGQQRVSRLPEGWRSPMSDPPESYTNVDLPEEEQIPAPGANVRQSLRALGSALEATGGQWEADPARDATLTEKALQANSPEAINRVLDYGKVPEPPPMPWYDWAIPTALRVAGGFGRTVGKLAPGPGMALGALVGAGSEGYAQSYEMLRGLRRPETSWKGLGLGAFFGGTTFPAFEKLSPAMRLPAHAATGAVTNLAAGGILADEQAPESDRDRFNRQLFEALTGATMGLAGAAGYELTRRVPQYKGQVVDLGGRLADEDFITPQAPLHGPQHVREGEFYEGSADLPPANRALPSSPAIAALEEQAGGPWAMPGEPGGWTPRFGGDEPQGPGPVGRPPQPRGLLPAVGDPFEGGAIPLPGEPLPPGREPFRGTQPPAPNQPRLPNPRTAPDQALHDAFVEAVTRGDMARAQELGDQIQARAWFDERFFQPPPEVAAAPRMTAPSAPAMPPFQFPKPVNIMGKAIAGIDFSGRMPALVFGMAPGDRMLVPWEVIDELRAKYPKIPARPAAPQAGPQAPAPDRFDIYAPEDRELMRQRTARWERDLRPQQGQQGLPVEGQFSTGNERAGRAIDELDRLLTTGVPGELNLTGEAGGVEPAPGALPAAPITRMRGQGAREVPWSSTWLREQPEPPPPALPGPRPQPVAPAPAPADVTPTTIPVRPDAPAAEGGWFQDLATRAREEGFIGTDDELRQAYDDWVGFHEAGREGVRQGIGAEDYDPVELLRAIARGGGISDPRELPIGFQKTKGLEHWFKRKEATEYDRLWEASSQFASGTHKRTGRPTARRGNGTGELGGVGSVLRVRGGLSFDQVRELLAQHPSFKWVEGLNEGEIASLVEEAARRANQAPEGPSAVPSDFWKQTTGYGDLAREVQTMSDDEFMQLVNDWFQRAPPEAPTRDQQWLDRILDEELSARMAKESDAQAFEESKRPVPPPAGEAPPPDAIVPPAEAPAPPPPEAPTEAPTAPPPAKGPMSVQDVLEAEAEIVELQDELKALNREMAQSGVTPATHQALTAQFKETQARLREVQDALTADAANNERAIDEMLDAARRKREGTAVAPPVEPPKPAAPADLGEVLGVPPTRSPLFRSIRSQVERLVAQGDIGEFSTGELKEITDRTGMSFGELKRKAIAGELDLGAKPVQDALDAIAATRESMRPGMKQAAQGEYLAPPDKDYAFIRLDDDVAHADAGLRKRLREAGYQFRNGQRAWFKNRGTMSVEELEAEAEALLGGPKGPPDAGAAIEPGTETVPGPVAPEAPKPPADLGEVVGVPPAAEEAAPPAAPPPPGDVNEFGEEQPGLGLDMPVEPGKVARAVSDEELQRLIDVNKAKLKNPNLTKAQREAAFQTAQELRKELEGRQAEVAAPPKAPEDLGSLLDVEPAAPAAPPAAPERTTYEQLPANVRSFVTRQLGWTLDEINARTVDEIVEAGRAKRTGPSKMRELREPPAPPPTTEPEPVAPTKQGTSPVPSAGGPGRPPESLEELLSGYLKTEAPGKMEQARERMRRAQIAPENRRLLREQTFHGGGEGPTATEPLEPVRQRGEWKPKTVEEQKALAARGGWEAEEQRLEAEAPAHKALRDELREHRIAEAEAGTARLTEKEAGTHQELAGKRPEERKIPREEGVNPSMNRARAKRMAEMIANPTRQSVDEYAKALTEQVTRENDIAIRGGTGKQAKGAEGGDPVWGDTFAHLKYDPEKGEYLGAGFGALQQLYDRNPGAFMHAIRVGGGALLGAAIGDSLEDDDVGGWALAGALAGAGATPANLRALARVARSVLPKPFADLRSLTDRTTKAMRGEPRKGVSPVRRGRDYAKDISAFDKYFRTAHVVDPQLFREVFPAFEEFAQAEAANPSRTPQMWAYMRKIHLREAEGQILAAERTARAKGHVNHADYLKELSRLLRGRPTMFEQKVGEFVPGGAKGVRRSMNEFKNWIYRTQIGFAVGTALVNRTQILLAIPHIGLKGVAKGVMEGMTEAGKKRTEFLTYGKDQPLWEMGTEGTTTAQPRGKYHDFMSKYDEYAFAPMRWTDNLNRRDVYLGARRYALEHGLEEAAAHDWATEVTFQTQGIPGDLGGNPFHRQLGPLRALAKYPVLWSEWLADMTTHPDPAVKARLVGLALGTGVVGSMVGLNTMGALVPRLSFVGPAGGVMLDTLAHLPGVGDADHPLTQHVIPDPRNYERSATGWAPRGIRQPVEVLSKRLPRELGGYGYGMGDRPIYDSRGNIMDTRSGVEDLARLLGFETAGVAERRKQRQAAGSFADQATEAKRRASSEAYRGLADALDQGDQAAVQRYSQMLSRDQLRTFYRNRRLSYVERTRRRTPREQRQNFDDAVR